MWWKTLGGRQFWTDRRLHRGWRIQQSVLTGHYRLLCPKDDRYTWGSWDHCRKRFAQIIRERNLTPHTRPVVIGLHGIVRSSKVYYRWRTACEAVGFDFLTFDYPSTRSRLADSGRYLREVIAHLDASGPIYLVGHSMGGLVIRAAFTEAVVGDTAVDPRIDRVVMLGTPNHGADLADRFVSWWPVRAVLGVGLKELVSRTDGSIASLAVPPVPFGLIAGAKGTPTGYNPLLPGDDDGVVTVESVKMPDAVAFTTVNCFHSFLPMHPPTIELALRFLVTGSFETDPVPAG